MKNKDIVKQTSFDFEEDTSDNFDGLDLFGYPKKKEKLPVGEANNPWTKDCKEKGICPKCATILVFSHFALICPNKCGYK